MKTNSQVVEAFLYGRPCYNRSLLSATAGLYSYNHHIAQVSFWDDVEGEGEYCFILPMQDAPKAEGSAKQSLVVKRHIGLVTRLAEANGLTVKPMNK